MISITEGVDKTWTWTNVSFCFLYFDSIRDSEMCKVQITWLSQMVPIFTLRKLSVCTIKIYLFVRLFSIKYVCSFYSAFTLKLFNRASKGYKRRPFLLKSGEMNQIWKGEKLLGVGPVAKIDECMSRIWLLCKKIF